MKIIKKILMGLGAIFALFIVLAIFLIGESAEFEENNEQFVRDYTEAFSQQWDISSVSQSTSNEMLEQINTPNGRHAMNVFRAFGELVEITDMEMDNFSTHSSGITSADFKFKAKFQNGNALVTVKVLEQDNAVRVNGFHIEPIGSVSAPKEIKA